MYYDDPFTGDRFAGCVYPRGTQKLYVYGGLELGAVAGRDTLANTGSWSMGCGRDSCRWRDVWRVSTSDPAEDDYSPEAHSELDLSTTFTDTVTHWMIPNTWPPWQEGEHKSLNLIATQRSMAWSGALVDDFVLIEYELLNVGDTSLRDVFVGFACSDYRVSIYEEVETDGLTGFLRGAHIEEICNQFDTLNIAYFMDNDGDPVGGRFPVNSRRAAVGVQLLGGSSDSLRVNYNWVYWNANWSKDWGPRRSDSPDEPYRSFSPYVAWPFTDRNYYYALGKPEIDYDQMFAAIPHAVEGWLDAGHYGYEVASGYRTFVFYSFGPFQLPVHERINFTIAVVGGDNVHTDPTAHFQPEFPQDYYDQLDFSELIENARWAKKVYDIPGFDTDGDGYRGEYTICDGDTAWLKGDGVPDFKADSPPPAPFTRYITERSKITVRWNGFFSETTKDPFTGLVDFEGYKVYAGLDDRRGSLSLLSSYDKLDYKRLWFRDVTEGSGRWESTEPPFSLDSLKAIYGDDFEPLDFPYTHPLIYNDTAWYFEPVLYNRYDLTNPRGIHKVYPDATNPGTDSTLWTDDDITTEHGRPLPKFYEYEYVYDNILPTVPYFMSVTALDYGFTGGRSTMPPQESNPLNNITEVYALPSTEQVEAEQLDVIVYPNPYRVDAHYEDDGFENRKVVIIPDRARLIHFANLPSVCKISIFSLDGDLIGTIKHDFPNGGPEAMHDWWDLSTRSGLTVTSGLYYWVVESDTRTQIGKLVILK